jgi:hypothetical protein
MWKKVFANSLPVKGHELIHQPSFRLAGGTPLSYWRFLGGSPFASLVFAEGLPAVAGGRFSPIPFTWRFADRLPTTTSPVAIRNGSQF